MIPVALGFLLAFVLHLGPETPVGTRASSAAASVQTSLSTAWNGHTGLAVWIDERGNYPADVFQPRIAAQQMLRVSPMRPDGSLVNPEGTPLFPAYKAEIASNGTSFMLAYIGRDGTYVVPLTDDGTPDGVTSRVGDGYSAFTLVANHSTYLFVNATGSSDFLVTIIQPSGILFASKLFDTGIYQAAVPAVTMFGDVYALAWVETPCQACAQKIHLALLADDAATTEVPIFQGNEINPNLSLAASDDRLMLAAMTSGGLQTLIVGRDLKVIAPFRTVSSGVRNFRALQPIVWDGQSFLITWQEVSDDYSEASWKAVRVSPDNFALDATPAVIAHTSPDDASLTRTSERIIATWFSVNDVYRRTFVSNADLFVQPETQTPAVTSVHAQSSASLTSFGGAPVRVWREGSLDSHIMLSIGDKTIDVASSTDRELHNPSVAAGANVIFVLWRDLQRTYFAISEQGQRIYARRFSFDGTPLDAQPVLLHNEDADYVDIELSTAAAFDGRNFVAIWSSNPDESHNASVRAMRISPAGTFVDSSPFLIAGVTDLGFTTGLRAVSTGNELLVAWSSWNDFRYIRGISPPPPPRTAIEIVRLDTRGGTMNVLQTRELWSTAELAKYAGLAWDGTNALLAGVHGGCVEVTLLDAALSTIKDNAKVECGTLPWNTRIEHTAVAWNGSEFVVAWAADAVRAMRFDRSLQALDDAPFNVAPAGAVSHEPAVAASPSGVEITYERLDSDVPRLFTRELDRAGIVPRGRTVGR